MPRCEDRTGGCGKRRNGKTSQMTEPFTAAFLLKTIAALLVTSSVALGFKFGLWLRDVKNNHLSHIQLASEQSRDAALAIPAAIETQTNAIVTALGEVKSELREQRQDIRTLTSKL